LVLLLGPRHDRSQPAPVGLDTLGVPNGPTPAPMHGQDQADNADKPPPARPSLSPTSPPSEASLFRRLTATRR